MGRCADLDQGWILGLSDLVEDQITAFGANHNRGGVGVATYQLRHHGSVCHEQSLCAMDCHSCGINHRLVIGSHTCGADGVLNGVGSVSHHLIQLCVGGDPPPGAQLVAAQGGQ